MTKRTVSRCAVAALLLAPAIGGAANPPPGPPDSFDIAVNNAGELDALNREWDEVIARMSQSTDPKLAANKKLVLEFLSNLVRAAEGRADISTVVYKYLDPGYIQHDPNVLPGRDGFIKWFKAGAMLPNTPRAPKTDPKRIGLLHEVLVIAEGDIVAEVSTNKWPDPFDDVKTYDQFHVGIFRVRNGRILEHWNEAAKGAYWCRLSMCWPGE